MSSLLLHFLAASLIANAQMALQFVPVTPCRLVDTRPDRGGSGPIQGGQAETFNLPQLAQTASPPCADLSSAAAYSLNVAVVPEGPLGYLTMYPTGQSRPVVATLNSVDGRIKANAAVIGAGTNGSIDIYVTNTTNVVLDIDGYFVPAIDSALAFYPLTPCRVADTRRTTVEEARFRAGPARISQYSVLLGAPYHPRRWPIR